MPKRKKMPLRGSRGANRQQAGGGGEDRRTAGSDDEGMRSGAEAVPPGTVEQHVTEHESGYGGNRADPRTSADQHQVTRADGSDPGTG